MNNAFGGMGFPPEAPIVLEFPVVMFDPGSDLTPLKENIDKIVYGLTRWEPALKSKGIKYPPHVTIAGKDYEEAVTSMNRLFLKNLWGDGLPILPATRERVTWIMKGTDLPPDKAVGKILPRGGIATVEALAVNLAMAGGRPEYLPVLVAAVEAMVIPKQRHFHANSTTNSCYPIVIVNGPIARQIRLNSGYGCLGPSSEFPAGAAIGRALRLALLDIGGGIPGIGSMALYGGPARYTNIVFAEDEESLPKGWQQLSADFGYSKGKNTLVFHNVSGTSNVNRVSVGTEKSALAALNLFAAFMRIPNANNYFLDTYQGSPGVVLMAKNTARGLAGQGWTKEKIKAYLWENTRLPWAEIEKCGLAEDVQRHGIKKGEMVPITGKPENIMIIVAGGEQSQHGYWMQMGVSGQPTTAEIKLPAQEKWQELMKQAEKDLGPVPAR